jgi:hypothetical protein
MKDTGVTNQRSRTPTEKRQSAAAGCRFQMPKSAFPIAVLGDFCNKICQEETSPTKVLHECTCRPTASLPLPRTAC